MTLNRYSARRDANERIIVAALRERGCLVLCIDTPDLLVQTPSGRHFVLEVKCEDGDLTERQKKMAQEGWRIPVVRSIHDALAAADLA